MINSDMLTPSIAIIDNAIKRPSLHCFNRLVDHFKLPFSYHMPPSMGIDSLINSPADAYIIFGSASNVTERLDWQQDLSNFIKEKILENVPTLGICFGHQLVADAFGCEIRAKKENEKFEGTRETEILVDHMGIRAGEYFTFAQAHEQEVVSITDDFVHLGTSSMTYYDALGLKNHPYLGVQGHPEASPSFMDFDLSVCLPEEEKNKAMSDGLEFISRFISGLEISKRVL